MCHKLADFLLYIIICITIIMPLVYDVFMNLALENAVEIKPKKREADQGNQEVSEFEVEMGMCVIRGNSILMVDCQER